MTTEKRGIYDGTYINKDVHFVHDYVQNLDILSAEPSKELQ